MVQKRHKSYKYYERGIGVAELTLEKEELDAIAALPEHIKNVLGDSKPREYANKNCRMCNSKGMAVYYIGYPTGFERIRMVRVCDCVIKKLYKLSRIK
jgi:hypothetical protein